MARTLAPLTLRLTKVVVVDTLETLDDFDILVVPGGRVQRLLRHLDCDHIRRFVSNGGRYIGICAGACAAASFNGSGMRLLPVTAVCPRWEKRTGLTGRATMVPYSADCVAAVGAASRVCGYYNGPVFNLNQGAFKAKRGRSAAVRAEYVLDQLRLKSLTKKMHAKAERALCGKACIVTGQYGSGTVLLCGPHPEFAKGLEAFTQFMIIGMGQNTENNQHFRAILELHSPSREHFSEFEFSEEDSEESELSA